MVGTESGLADGQGPLVQAAGVVHVSFGVRNEGKVVQAQRGLWMVRAQLGLTDR